MDFYISLETAKQLKEWGCILPSKKGWYGEQRELTFHGTSYYKGNQKKEYGECYHLLEDVCVKYAKDFFGDKYVYCGGYSIPAWQSNTEDILKILQKGEKEKAEKYLLENTIFNPKNK